MSLVKFSQRPMSSFLDEFFSPQWSNKSQNFTTSIPAVNVQEREKDFLLSFAVPGKSKSDFEIEVDKEVLSVSALAKDTSTEDYNLFTRKEFNYQSFKRSFTLPESVDTAKIKAQYKEGILSIHLPKRKEALPQPTKRIAIE
ncbi:MAG: Hsp20/alpha crystallin family protein [Flavobacteriaceae bacterium]